MRVRLSLGSIFCDGPHRFHPKRAFIDFFAIGAFHMRRLPPSPLETAPNVTRNILGEAIKIVEGDHVIEDQAAISRCIVLRRISPTITPGHFLSSLMRSSSAQNLSDVLASPFSIPMYSLASFSI